ncbi:MAG: peptide MFS transporter [Williamsia sp.]|nr:peptide MFS transporter [Williamsia sp.]
MRQRVTASNSHPTGLYILATTEMWERFNYYGMRSILTLFMTKALLLDKAYSSNLYGSYTGLIFLTPLIGGYVADRYWGNSRSIVMGGLVMAIGEFFLFFCSNFYKSAPQLSGMLFFVGLGCMIAGNGLFKPNISSLVGQLYPSNDRRKDAAYTIFYMGINTGAALGPLICGGLGDTNDPSDFKWAFLAGGIGMIISVIIQKIFQRRFVIDPTGTPLGGVPAGSPRQASNPLMIAGSLFLFAILMIGILYTDAKVFGFLPYLLAVSALFIIVFIFSDKSLTPVEKQKIQVIFIVSFFVVFFWTAFEQAGVSLTFFAEEKTRRNLGWSWLPDRFKTIPTSWFQTLNALFVVGFAPLFAWLWLKLGKREPSSPTKMAIGLLLIALGFLVIATGAKGLGPGIKVSMIWLTVMYAFHTWGELSISPIGLSLVNKLSPLKFASLLMAVWFLANALANKLAGSLSSLYPEEGKTTHLFGYQINNLYDYFMLFVFASGLASLILFLISKKLQSMMKGGKYATEDLASGGADPALLHN